MRRGFLICGLLLLAGLALYFLPRWVVDDALILNWRVNRATFDQLVSLYLADDPDQYVSSTGSYSVQPAYPGPPTPFPTPAPTSAGRPTPGVYCAHAARWCDVVRRRAAELPRAAPPDHFPAHSRTAHSPADLGQRATGGGAGCDRSHPLSPAGIELVLLLMD